MLALESRVVRARQQMQALDVDVLCLAEGPDLLYLTGYAAMPLERLTMLILRATTTPCSWSPDWRWRVVQHEDLFTVRPWVETEDPIQIVADRVRSSKTIAIGDTTWARFVLALQAELQTRGSSPPAASPPRCGS